MTAVFVHDHYFVYNPDDCQYYDGSGGVFNYQLWNRYLTVFDNLVVVGREAKALPNKLVLSSAPNVGFSLIDDIKSGKDRILKARVVKYKLRKIIEKADCCIIRLPSTLGYFVFSLCRRMGKRYVIEVVGCPWDAYWNYGTLLTKCIAPIERYKLQRVARLSKASIYVTRNFLQKRYPTKGWSENISNVKIDSVIPVEEALTFYDLYDQHVQEFRIGLIGSFHVKYKGHTEAFRAIKRLVEHHGITNLKLFLVGTGNTGWIKREIDTLGIQEYVEIIGTLNAGSEGILPFLDSLHLYIQPSKTEGLPRTLIEAMSRGRLSIGSTAGGIPELLGPEYLHEPADWSILADKIADIYKSRNKWKEIVMNNISVAKRYVELYLQQKRVNFLSKVSNLNNSK